MTRCCRSCTPTCQHCVHAEFEQIEMSGRTYASEAEKCKLHPDQGIDGSYWCKDFYCIRANIKVTEKMTQEKWLSYSEQWRKGYNAYNNYENITQEDWNLHSQDWRDGFIYALHNPIGPYYSIDVTTGR